MVVVPHGLLQLLVVLLAESAPHTDMPLHYHVQELCAAGVGGKKRVQLVSLGGQRFVVQERMHVTNKRVHGLRGRVGEQWERCVRQCGSARRLDS